MLDIMNFSYIVQNHTGKTILSSICVFTINARRTLLHNSIYNVPKQKYRAHTPKIDPLPTFLKITKA